MFNGEMNHGYLTFIETGLAREIEESWNRRAKDVGIKKSRLDSPASKGKGKVNCSHRGYLA